MKKKLILLPIFALLLAGCGNKPSEDTSAPPSSSEGGIELPSEDEPLPEPSSEKESIPDTDYVTIEAARTAAKEADTNVTIKGTITEIYGMASNKFGVIVQEGNYALTLSFVEDVTDLAIGDYVSATGKTQIFNGLYQLSNSTITKLEGDAPVITPMVITEWSNEALEGKDGAQVVVDGLKFVSGKITVGTNSPIDVKLGEKQFQIYMSGYIDTEIQEALKAKFDSVTINDTIKFTGAVGMYKNYQLNPLRAETVEITKGEAVTLSALGFNPAAKEITVEDEYDAAATLVVTPNGAPIEGLVYASSDPEVATVDAAGKVTAVAPGSATITAKVGDIVGELALTVEEPINSAATLTFPHEGTESSAGYTATFKAIIGSFEWEIFGFNSQNNSWDHLRGGRKSDASTAYIATVGSIAEKIEKVSVSVSQIKNGLVTSTKLTVASDADFTQDVQVIDGPEVAVGVMDYVIPNPGENLYYKLDYVFAVDGSGNGNFRITQVAYMIAE